MSDSEWNEIKNLVKQQEELEQNIREFEELQSFHVSGNGTNPRITYDTTYGTYEAKINRKNLSTFIAESLRKLKADLAEVNRRIADMTVITDNSVIVISREVLMSGTISAERIEENNK